MSPLQPVPTSLRSARLRALAPRLALYSLVLVFGLAGVRATFAEPPRPAPAVARPTVATGDLGAQAFAEAFAQAYLSWDDDQPERRQNALALYLSDGMDPDGGLSPRQGTSQAVAWTTVLGSRRSSNRELVTVAAQTTEELVYLTVPVSRDSRGFLVVPAYPAFVGPPATTRRFDPGAEDEVDDAGLETVVERAVTNYLARANRNLLADLTPGAVVSLPPEALRATQVSDLAWVERPRRVAAEVAAEDARGNSWTLRYELDVVKRDRWYVRSLQVDPTFKEVVK